MPVQKPGETGVRIIGTPLAQWLGKFGMHREMGEKGGKTAVKIVCALAGKSGKTRLRPADRNGFLVVFTNWDRVFL